MNLELKKGEVYLISGLSVIKVEEGLIDCIGADIEKGSELKIPRGKTVPIEAKEESKVSIKSEETDFYKKMDGRTIPEEWDALVEKLIKSYAKIVLVLGEMDTGKTFFSTYIANRLLAHNVVPGILDCDTGQSDVGPPTTFGLAILKEQNIFLHAVKPDNLFFLGAHSPGLHMTTAVVGVKHLSEIALKKCDTLIVDTTGWVQFDGGRLIKTAKIDILNPDFVVLLQRGEELEHLVRGVDEKKIVRLVVSKKSTPTSPDDRKKLREYVSQSYFANAKKCVVDLDKVYCDRTFFKTGFEQDTSFSDELLWLEKLSGWEGCLAVTKDSISDGLRQEISKKFGMVRNVIAGFEKNMLIGLLDEKKEAMAIGSIEKIDFLERKISFYSPLEDASKVKYVQFGSMKYLKDGTEAGFVIPGNF